MGCSGSGRAPRSRARRLLRGRPSLLSVLWKRQLPPGDRCRRSAPASGIRSFVELHEPARAGEESARLVGEPVHHGKVMGPWHRDIAGEGGAPALTDEGVLAMKLARFVAADAGHDGA